MSAPMGGRVGVNVGVGVLVSWGLGVALGTAVFFELGASANGVWGVLETAVFVTRLVGVIVSKLLFEDVIVAFSV